jgi:membrane-associated phospholipid phosphatase
MSHFQSNTAGSNVVEAVLGYLRATARHVLSGFRSHALYYGIVCTVYAVGALQGLHFGIPISTDLIAIGGNAFAFVLGAVAVIWLISHFIALWRSGYRGSPTLALINKLATDIAAPSRLANIFHVVVLYSIFFIGFITVKKSIPYMTGGFTWDASFMALDKTLHAGSLPHEWLMPVLGSYEAIFATNLAYNIWFVVMMFCWFCFGFAKHDSQLRHQYLLAYFLCWITGTLILGTIFSSAGPCFYGFVVQGENPYSPFLAHLRAANDLYSVWAVPTQDMLWQSYQAGHGEVEGISAMPSLHVATSVLFVLLALKWGKRWFIAFTIPFAIWIFLGSIMLGWHYAVDGYAGAAIAVACWWAAGKYVKRRFV